MLAEPKQVVPSWWLTSGPITVANDNRENRYDRSTHDVEQVTDQPPQTIEQYVASHPDLFA
jgi:hypothetical protein